GKTRAIRAGLRRAATTGAALRSECLSTALPKTTGETGRGLSRRDRAGATTGFGVGALLTAVQGLPV
ncbi:MAG: hypothetical protein ACK4ST_16505, partial [Elioraea tepidiphila]